MWPSFWRDRANPWYHLHRIASKALKWIIYKINSNSKQRFLFPVSSFDQLQLDPVSHICNTTAPYCVLSDWKRRGRPPRVHVLQAPGSRTRAELAASCHPSQLHHMTYVGADGRGSPLVIIYQRRLWRSDRAGRLVEGSRSKSPPSRVELLWTDVFQRTGADLRAS